MNLEIEIRRVYTPDLPVLHQTCLDTYTQNFAHHWEVGGLEKYVSDVFGMDTLKEELAGDHILYYIAFYQERPLAFMKLNRLSNLPGFDPTKGMELDKVYVLPEMKGLKIGKRLLNHAIDLALAEKKEIFWLAVIDTNHEAISFYEKAGFTFHSKVRIKYPKFKDELRGMWRMSLQLT